MTSPPDLPAPAEAAPIELALAPPVVAMPSAAAKRLEVRIWCTFVFALVASMFAVAIKLQPSPTGMGSHQELGFPPCGWLQTLGYPCPTCGCTTAVTHFAHGHILVSFLTQPFGFAVALLGALLFPLTLFGLISGRWIGPSMFWINWHWRLWVFGGLALLLAAWGYKAYLVSHGITW